MRTWLVVAALALVACKQSHKEAWRQICNAPHGNTPDSAHEAAMWVRDHVTNSEAQKELASLGSIERESARLEIIKAMVEEAGIDAADCPILRP